MCLIKILNTWAYHSTTHSKMQGVNSQNGHKKVCCCRKSRGAGVADQGGGGTGPHPVRRQPHCGRGGSGAGSAAPEAHPHRRTADAGGRAPHAPHPRHRGGGAAAAPDGGGAAHAGGGQGAGRHVHQRGHPLAAGHDDAVPAGAPPGGVRAVQRRLPRCGPVAGGRKRGSGLRGPARRGGQPVRAAVPRRAGGRAAQGAPTVQSAGVPCGRDRQGAHHLPAGDLQPRCAAGTGRRGCQAGYPVPHQGRLCRHCHGAAGAGRQHHAVPAAAGQQ